MPHHNSTPTLVAESNSTKGKNTLNAQIERMLASRCVALISENARASFD